MQRFIPGVRPADEQILQPDDRVSVGIGYASLTCDGEVVYEAECFEFEHGMTVDEAEQLAKRRPERDWRIHLVALRDERHYRRQRDGNWVLYRRGYGLS